MDVQDDPVGRPTFRAVFPRENRVVSAVVLIFRVDTALDKHPTLVHDLPVKIQRTPVIREEINVDLIVLVQVCFE
jgi:hypothetical protein